jgi:hypothetical protein
LINSKRIGLSTLLNSISGKSSKSIFLSCCKTRKNTGERGTHLDGLNLEMKVQKNFMLQLLNGRLNTITSLDTGDGRTANDHHGKAFLLWEEYKARLGCSAQTQMFFNIHELVQQHNLHHIETPFTREDIDNVVKRLPTDIAPDLMASMDSSSKKLGTSLRKIYISYASTFSMGQWIFKLSTPLSSL